MQVFIKYLNKKKGILLILKKKAKNRAHPLIPIRTYAVCLIEFAGPRNRAPFQTFYAQAGLGHGILPKK